MPEGDFRIEVRKASSSLNSRKYKIKAKIIVTISVTTTLSWFQRQSNGTRHYVSIERTVTTDEEQQCDHKEGRKILIILHQIPP